MGFLNAPVSAPPKRWREDPAGRLIGLITMAIFGVLLGIEYWTPNKRVIPVVAALMVFGIAWRLSMVAAVNVLVFLLPYPKGTVFGSTNLALIMLVFVIWLVRLSLKMSAPARSSPIDMPIFGLLLWYILSFYNVGTGVALENALQNFGLFAACIVMYYLIINNIRTQKDLERLHLAQVITALGVFLVASWELHNPGKILIPGLLDFTATTGNDFNTHNVRVGASFRDYELLSEYCGMMLLMTYFLFARARSQTRRVLFGLLGVFNLYTMFTTVTRGVIIALMGALPYMFYVIRRRLNPVKFMSAVAAILVVSLAMNFLVAQYTNSGDMFERLGSTKIVHGVVPEAREAPWANAWNRALLHPILGQGPYYTDIPGYEMWWPHNVYLYVANLVGFPGLAFFVMILIGLFVLLRPVVDNLNHDSYADAYLIVARTQFILFLANELKIDYLRNPIYQFQIWQLFATWTAAYMVSREFGVRAITPLSEPETPPSHRMAG